jgi:hypothetical protein
MEIVGGRGLTMSMDHKAFVFDYDGFKAELEKTLYEALNSGPLEGLERFIETNLDQLKDPYEGRPLDRSWRSLLESKDAHQYGDIAISKFYDPGSDIGLGSDWELVARGLEKDSGLPSVVILGDSFGPTHNRFDPGKMGSYFFSKEAAQDKFSKLRALAKKPSLREILPDAVKMFNLAVASGKGLYTTF